ncbi:MAG: hypothetical protein KAT66_06555, partial [Candidatus Lokiarchaeota archaeon]|nr:hypothetical protein [Candidatus Lokiarchaeota archaeon]
KIEEVTEKKPKKVAVKEKPKKVEAKIHDEEALQKQYEEETGKKSIWRGKETKGYIEWKKEKMG